MTAQKPLPERMRPDDPDLFLGQSHLASRLKSLMAAERLPSLLLFGPPGCGKSTLALLLARSRKRPYLRLSAPEAGLQHLRRSLNGIEILVLDELHRFSKAQQDFFLPLVESGELTLLATTTENPSFSVTRQLLSRLHVLRLRPLGRSELMELARRGAEQTGVTLSDEVLDIITAAAHGDARTLLNLVEYAASLPEEMREPEQLKSALPEVMMRHDKDGDSHYELASALIKSIRGSDPDGAIYWLARMVEGGEDPAFIARRLVISASEDIGLANPNALLLANACFDTVMKVGWPEGRIPLAETTIYLATSPKSNSAYMAINDALELVRQTGNLPVPLHLRNAPTKLMKQLGYGDNYKYAHDYPGHFVRQQFLPDELADRHIWTPQPNAAEQKHKERMQQLWGDRFQ